MSTIDLHDLRDDIARLQTERRRLTARAVRTVEDARADLRRFFEQAAAAGRARLAQGVISGELRDAFLLRDSSPGLVDLAPLLLALLPAKALAAACEDALQQLPAAPDPVDHANALAAVDAELDALERAEEREVCRLEALGQRVMRRADARPEIVLALEVCDDVR